MTIFQTALKLVLLSVLAFLPTQIANGEAYVSQYEIGFGPFVGGGSISDNSQVRHTTGYAVSIERNWDIGQNLAIGPRIEMVSSAMSTKTSNDEKIALRTFDSSIVAGGAKLSYAAGASHTFVQGAYLIGMYGTGSTDLTINESTERTYMQNRLREIRGQYSSFEIGTWIPVKGSFGVNLAFLSNTYKADFSSANGKRSGDSIDKQGNLFALTEAIDAENNGLENSAVLNTYAIKLGLVLGF